MDMQRTVEHAMARAIDNRRRGSHSKLQESADPLVYRAQNNERPAAPRREGEMAGMQSGYGQEFFRGGLLFRSRFAKVAEGAGGFDSHVLGRHPRGSLGSARSSRIAPGMARGIPGL